MKSQTFNSQNEAEKAVVEFYQERNAARGQYPQRISPKRQWMAINPDGSVLYEYAYKNETVRMLCGCYHTEVVFTL